MCKPFKTATTQRSAGALSKAYDPLLDNGSKPLGISVQPQQGVHLFCCRACVLRGSVSSPWACVNLKRAMITPEGTSHTLGNWCDKAVWVFKQAGK